MIGVSEIRKSSKYGKSSSSASLANGENKKINWLSSAPSSIDHSCFVYDFSLFILQELKTVFYIQQSKGSSDLVRFLLYCFYYVCMMEYIFIISDVNHLLQDPLLIFYFILNYVKYIKAFIGAVKIVFCNIQLRTKLLALSCKNAILIMWIYGTPVGKNQKYLHHK